MLRCEPVVPFLVAYLLQHLFTLVEVSNEPLKDLDVTVNRYIDVIHRRRLSEILLEVLHVLDKQVPLTPKVFVDFPVFIKDMNCDELALHFHLAHDFWAEHPRMALFAVMGHVHELKIIEGYPHVLILPQLRVHTQPMLVYWWLLVVANEIKVLLRHFEKAIVLSLIV